jgi:hypothetical protein
MKTTYCHRKTDENERAVHPLMLAIKNARSEEELKTAWNYHSVGDVSWVKSLNDELTYNSHYDGVYYHLTQEQPIFYAVTLNKPFLVPFLKEKGAVDTARRRLLTHGLDHLTLDGLKIVENAGFKYLCYTGLLKETSEPFDYSHKHFFIRTLTEIVKDENPNSDQNKKYYQLVTKEEWYRLKLKPTYLRVITENNEIKSSLKKQWLLSIQNPVIQFLKTSKTNNQIKDTDSYKKLVGMLKKHQFQLCDLTAWRDELRRGLDDPANFTLNPTLAALYFAHCPADNAEDYRIFEKHLMITPTTGYSPAKQATLNHLLSSDGLSSEQLKTLKQNISSIMKFNGDAYQASKETLTDAIASPLKTIVRTGKLIRSDQNTATFKFLQTQGFFKPSVVAPAAYNAYQPEHIILKS